MRKFLVLLLVLMAAGVCKAQLPVTDPGNLAVLLEQLNETTSQTKQLGQQTLSLKLSEGWLKKGVDLVTRVNSAVKNIMYAKQVLSDQVRLVIDCSRVINSVSKGNNLRNYKNLLDNVDAIIRKNKDFTEYLSKALSPDMKMTDSERLNILNQVDEKTQELRKELRRVQTMYEGVDEMKQFLKK